MKKSLIYRAHKILKEDDVKELIRRIGMAVKRRLFFLPRDIRWWYSKRGLKSRYIKRDAQGNTMLIDSSDSGVSRDIILDGVHELELTKRVRKELSKGDVVVDVGANIGYYALIEAKSVSETGKVYAVEPERSNFELLEKNIELNSYSNVECYNVAIGNVNGKSKFYISDEGRNWHSMNENSPAAIHGKCIEVRTFTLDEFLKDKRPVDVIRMDIEGYESTVIEGMKKTLADREVKLFVELHFGLTDLTAFLETLRELGYRYIYLLHRDEPLELNSTTITELTKKNRTIHALFKKSDGT